MWWTCLLVSCISGLPRFSPAAPNDGIIDVGLSKPAFLSKGNTFRVVVGDSVILPCEVKNLGILVVVWRKGGALLTAGQHLIASDPRLSLHGYSLQISDIQHSDQGDYTCQIGDGTHGDLIHSVEILMPPSIQIVPPTGQTTTRKGGSVAFECRTTGNPSPVVRWSKRDGVLPADMHVEGGSVLSLKDAQRHHSGVYQCSASNGIGLAATADVHLHVLYPPEVNALRTWANSGDGLEARLDCVVGADPPAEVSWYQNSFLLQPTDRRIMAHHGATHSLTVRHIQPADFGNYSCVVANSIGREKKFIELSGKPGAPVVVSSAHSRAPRDYTLSWRVQSVFPITEVRVLYRMINLTHHLPGQWHDLLVRPPQLFDAATSERTQSYRLLDLQPDAVYECLVQAKNQHGFGELSDLHQWFTSLPGGRPIVADSATTSRWQLHLTLAGLALAVL